MALASNLATSTAYRDRTDSDTEPRQGPPLDFNTSQHHQQEETNGHHLRRSDFDPDQLSPFPKLGALTPSSFESQSPAGRPNSLGLFDHSDLSELDEDPFFGADFDNVGQDSPSFLNNQGAWVPGGSSNLGKAQANGSPDLSRADAQGHALIYPLTPGLTASIHNTPRSDPKSRFTPIGDSTVPDSISPAQLQKTTGRTSLEQGHLPHNHTHTTFFSVDGSNQVQPNAHTMPRLSDQGYLAGKWERMSNSPHSPQGSMQDSPTTITETFLPRAEEGSPPRTGLDPDSRPQDEMPSLNETAKQNHSQERDEVVSKWITNDLDDKSVPVEKSPEQVAAIERCRQHDSIDDGIPVGSSTRNQPKPGHTYYAANGGSLSEEDYNIILANRNWSDGPSLSSITRADQPRHQPQTSAAAMQRFERMCRDNDSILSRVATWGTRRRSLPSVADLDISEVTSGNILKKLSITKSGDKNGNKSGSILKDLRGLVRRPSTSGFLKRSRSTTGRDSRDEGEPLSKPTSNSSSYLAPPDQSTGWGKRPTPSINTALISMGHASATIGTVHARSGSVSGGTPISSPRSPRNSLSVMGSLRRPRSRSDLPKASPHLASPENYPNLVGMLARSGGPPVPNINPTKESSRDYDEEDEEDEEGPQDPDMKTNANLIDNVPPNFAGFQQHVVALNPFLAYNNTFLVERIAHQQIVRYKQLLNGKVKHLNLGANCPSGSLCVALGGTANLLDQTPDDNNVSGPLSAHYEDGDEGVPVRGAISQETFRKQNVPLPPTGSLPAEFECQLCFLKKRFQKPSDWTKHVHEDVQPYTCTWEKCREPNIFKRKADWVRHENEGHRHLEWWTCDVDECRHTCYRRDNFLQHLVREHKFVEPKIKTKAAMKKAGGVDSTCERVEMCRKETTKRPQEEPCRFCGKQFSVWKKLTTHLAEHMEHISLPVLRLVEAKAKEMGPDTIISPVQDPPPRNPAIFAPTPVLQPAQQQQQNFGNPTQPFVFPLLPNNLYDQPYVPQHVNSLDVDYQPPSTTPEMMRHMSGMQQTAIMHDGSTQNSYDARGYVNMAENTQMNQLPQYNALGLQDTSSVDMTSQYELQGQQTMFDGSSGNASPFSGQGFASPYQHSPNNDNGTSQHPWGGQNQSGFM